MVDAIWMLSPFFSTGRAGRTPKWIIIHGTAGGASAENIAAWFRNPNANVSAHYVIGRDGTIIQCVKESDTAWANGGLSAGHDTWWSLNPNAETISIELVKPRTDNGDTISEPQRASCFALVRDICRRNAIPARDADRNGGITGHYSIDPVNRSRCPGPFPWDELWSYLKSGEQKGGDETVLQLKQVSQWFQELEKDKRWRCQVPSALDGGYYDIAYALLSFYRTFGQVGLNGFSIFGLPLSGEIRIPGTKNALIQRCERGIMLYDPSGEVDRVPGLSGPCYPANLQKEAIRALIDTGGSGNDAQVKALKDQLNDRDKRIAYIANAAGQIKQAATL